MFEMYCLWDGDDDGGAYLAIKEQLQFEEQVEDRNFSNEEIEKIPGQHQWARNAEPEEEKIS